MDFRNNVYFTIFSLFFIKRVFITIVLEMALLHQGIRALFDSCAVGQILPWWGPSESIPQTKLLVTRNNFFSFHFVLRCHLGSAQSV